MRSEGVLEAAVPPEKFYAFVTQPSKIISILPDVEESKVVDAEHFSVKSKVGMSYIKGTVAMNFEIVDKKKDAFVRMVGRGQGVQSSVDMTLTVALERSPGGTKATWTSETKVGGLLASVGSRLLDGVSEKYIKRITESLRQKVE
jgi:carbon monoxide dehydrogenase subunit G